MFNRLEEMHAARSIPPRATVPIGIVPLHGSGPTQPDVRLRTAALPHQEFLTPGTACPVKIIINHPITFTGNSSIGGGFMDSLIVTTGGNLTFTGSLDVTTNEFQPSVGAFSFTVRGDKGIYHDELVTVRIISATGQYDIIESKVGGDLNALVSDHLSTKAAGIYTFE